jgi:glucokinase
VSEALPAFGFDVGGQSAKVALVSPSGDVVAQTTIATGDGTTADSLADAISATRKELCAAHSVPAGAAVGVGIAGVLGRDGALRGAPHLPLLVGCRLAELIGARTGAAAVVHNDVDCAAVAEGWGGAADGLDDYLMIAIGTGVGSGLVLGGRLRVGRSNFGCEFGHAMVVHQGRRCGCGNLGCLEAYICETAARAFADEAPNEVRERIAARREKAGGGFAQAIFELGAAGDADAEAIAAIMVDMLGAAIGSVVNVLDLETIVLGGGIAPGVLARLARLRAAMAGTLFVRAESEITILAAARGSLAGAIGAARLGMLAR